MLNWVFVFQKRFQESSRRIKEALEDEKLGNVISGSIYIKYGNA
jgi:predicted dehydrogenase